MPLPFPSGCNEIPITSSEPLWCEHPGGIQPAPRAAPVPLLYLGPKPFLYSLGGGGVFPLGSHCSFHCHLAAAPGPPLVCSPLVSNDRPDPALSLGMKSRDPRPLVSGVSAQHAHEVRPPFTATARNSLHWFLLKTMFRNHPFRHTAGGRAVY